MAVSGTSVPSVAPARGHGSVRWALTAAGALLGASALQLQASLQRWVTARDSWQREDRSIEDHLFDYGSPADPWENIGSAAQVHGLGVLLLAAGVVAMGRVPAPPVGRAARAASIAAAVAFGLTGLHALVSGLLGAPSPLQAPLLQIVLALVPLIGLGALAVAAHRVSWPTAIASLCLLGSTVPGLVVATFVVAPALAGYQSHDTTPWTETVVAASTLLAGCAMLLAAGGLAVRRRGSASAGVGRA